MKSGSGQEVPDIERKLLYVLLRDAAYYTQMVSVTAPLDWKNIIWFVLDNPQAVTARVVKESR